VTRIFDHLADRGDAPDRIVDYLSGMTDRFALEFAAGIPE
jgi:dGTP triphosphohydrolase